MTYEKKYKIARAGLDHLERAFVDMSKAHEEYRKTTNEYIWQLKVDKKAALSLYNNELKDKCQLEIQLKKERDNLQDECGRLYGLLQYELNKTWWQKLKETIKSKYQ